MAAESTTTTKSDEVHRLKTMLAEATRDMNELSSKTEMLQKELESSKSKLLDYDEERQTMEQKYEVEFEKVRRDLEESREETDELKKRNVLYEKNYYGLTEAVQEVKELKQSVQVRDKKINDLLNKLSEMKLELNDSYDEVQYLRELCEAKDVDPNFDSKTVRSSVDSSKIVKLQQRIIELEEQLIESLHDNQQEKQTPLGDTNQLDKELQLRISDLENENADLKLGMKEILLNIQDSDVKSDFSIDCPSLERLCQQLESRSLSVQLGTAIAMKAELDLLRGQNEQLRSDIKKIRCEYLHLLTLYSQDIVENSKSEDNSAAVPSVGEIGQRSEGEIISNVTVDEPESDSDSSGSNDAHVTLSVDNLDIPSINSATQTEITGDFLNSSIKDEQAITSNSQIAKQDFACQTEPNQELLTVPQSRCSSPLSECPNCLKVVQSFEEVQVRLNRLEQSLAHSEDNFEEQARRLQAENSKLITELTLKQETQDRLIAEKDKHLKDLKDQLKRQRNQTVTISEAKPQDSQVQAVPFPAAASKGCNEILTAIIDCLQARILHKDDSIKEYQRLLRQTKESCEKQIAMITEQYKDHAEKIARISLASH
ncbi:hypothetical protein HDE_13854 [Halotydeus destructor]|nr:hypothetical protein HDE_13854 [Halotydeus destructor]